VETEKDPARSINCWAIKLAAEGVPDAQIAAQTKALTSPWFRYFLTYDSATALRKLTCPVLALSGEKDLQVPPAQNLPPSARRSRSPATSTSKWTNCQA